MSRDRPVDPSRARAPIGSSRLRSPVRWNTAEWRKQWIDEHAEHRNYCLHFIGNLTLLTEPRNLEVSNGPWPAKRSPIDEYSAFRLNRDVVSLTVARMAGTRTSSTGEAPT